MVMRKHGLTRTFRGEEAYDKAANYIMDAPEPYRSFMMIDERTEAWEEQEEFDCSHEWIWHSINQMVCTGCTEVRTIECPPSPEGVHAPYLAGPATGEWLCAHCFTPVEAPQTS